MPQTRIVVLTAAAAVVASMLPAGSAVAATYSITGLSPSDSSLVTTTTPLLSAAAVSPAPGITNFTFSVSTLTGAAVVSGTVKAVPSGGGYKVQWAVPSGALTPGQGYSWRIVASLGGDGSSTPTTFGVDDGHHTTPDGGLFAADGAAPLEVGTTLTDTQLAAMRTPLATLDGMDNRTIAVPAYDVSSGTPVTTSGVQGDSDATTDTTAPANAVSTTGAGTDATTAGGSAPAGSSQYDVLWHWSDKNGSPVYDRRGRWNGSSGFGETKMVNYHNTNYLVAFNTSRYPAPGWPQSAGGSSKEYRTSLPRHMQRMVDLPQVQGRGAGHPPVDRGLPAALRQRPVRRGDDLLLGALPAVPGLGPSGRQPVTVPQGPRWDRHTQGELLLELSRRPAPVGTVLGAVEFTDDRVEVTWSLRGSDPPAGRLGALLADLGMHMQTAFDPDYRTPGALLGRIAVTGPEVEITVLYGGSAYVTILDLRDHDEEVATAYSIADWIADGRGESLPSGERRFAFRSADAAQ